MSSSSSSTSPDANTGVLRGFLAGCQMFFTRPNTSDTENPLPPTRPNSISPEMHPTAALPPPPPTSDLPSPPECVGPIPLRASADFKGPSCTPSPNQPVVWQYIPISKVLVWDPHQEEEKMSQEEPKHEQEEPKHEQEEPKHEDPVHQEEEQPMPNNDKVDSSTAEEATPPKKQRAKRSATTSHVEARLRSKVESQTIHLIFSDSVYLNTNLPEFGKKVFIPIFDRVERMMIQGGCSSKVDYRVRRLLAWELHRSFATLARLNIANGSTKQKKKNSMSPIITSSHHLWVVHFLLRLTVFPAIAFENPSIPTSPERPVCAVFKVLTDLCHDCVKTKASQEVIWVVCSQTLKVHVQFCITMLTHSKLRPNSTVIVAGLFLDVVDFLIHLLKPQFTQDAHNSTSSLWLRSLLILVLNLRMFCLPSRQHFASSEAVHKVKRHLEEHPDASDEDLKTLIEDELPGILGPTSEVRVMRNAATQSCPPIAALLRLLPKVLTILQEIDRTPRFEAAVKELSELLQTVEGCNHADSKHLTPLGYPGSASKPVQMHLPSEVFEKGCSFLGC